MEKREIGTQRSAAVTAGREWKQRDSLSNFSQRIFVLMSMCLCTVSSSTVSIVSGFEKHTIQPGENLTLECRATGLYHVTITWLLDGLPLEYSTPEPSPSIYLKADNPHSMSGVRDGEGSRYWIENSNEISESRIALGIKDSIDIEAESNDSHASLVPKRTTVNKNARLGPNNQNPPPLLAPPDIPLSEDGKLIVTSSLTLRNATVADGGVYSCVARDVMRESVRWTRKIAVLGSLSLRQNKPTLALTDSLVVIPCTVLGTGDNIAVKWFFQQFSDTDETIFSSENPWISLPDGHRQTVHKNGSLEIRGARKNDEGVYRCQAVLNEKLTNMSTPLKVMVPPKIKSFAFPQVQVGKTFAEFCVVTEGDLPLDISWYKDGALLRPSERIGMHRSEKRALSLTISGVSLSSAGNYSCCAGNNVSQTCTVSKLVVLDPPSIIDLPTRVAFISGEDVAIPCQASGFPRPNVTWMRVVDDSKREYLQVPHGKIDGKPHGEMFPRVYQTKNGSLMISNVSSTHGGKYLCRAQNKVDELSRFVKLQVHNLARVIELTGTQDVAFTNDVIIECTSWGDGDVTVRWLKDGKPVVLHGRYIGTSVRDHSSIEGHPVSLDRLTVINTTRKDNGSYTCVASNAFGTSTKTMGVLIRAPPTPPGKFDVILKGTSFLRMIVSPGDDDGGSKLLSYELTVTEIVEEISPAPPEHEPRAEDLMPKEERRATVVKYPASATTTDQEIVLDQLECGTEYAMSIRSVNEIGRSFQGADLRARTIGTVPIISEANDLVVGRNQTAVVLDLRAWQNGGCPITDLTIEYARHGDTDWNLTIVNKADLERVLSPQWDSGNKSGKNHGHVVISNLETGTWYKIWSSACNNAGCNYITRSVSTLRVDGSTVPPMKIDVEKEATERDDIKFLVPMVCGFGLVLILVLLLLFYRHKQRSKKLMRLKAARKMANKLLYKTDDHSASTPSGGMRVELPEERQHDDSDVTGGEVPVETSVSCAEEDDNSVSQQVTRKSQKVADDTITAKYFEDTADANSDTLTNLPRDRNPSYAACGSHNSNNSSTNGGKSDGKKSLKDNAELAVFRGTASSDEEDHVREPLVCDESAFGDSGTWSYFQPGSKARRPKKYAAVPTVDKKPQQVPRRLSSSSSGTDEELAQVFGLTSSKKQFKSVLEKEVVLKSDVNENYRPVSDNHPRSKYTPQRQTKQGACVPCKKNENYYTVVDHERANSTGMMQKADPRFFKALPGDVSHADRRLNCPAQYHPSKQNTNPFKAGFRPAQQTSVNFHQPRITHDRGHTYSNGVPANWSGHFPSDAQFGNPLNSSPYGERQWVDTYDSRCSTTRSKPPSWGSTELDKQSFHTPQSTGTAATPRENEREGTPKFHTPEILPDRRDSSFATKETRKLDTNSPRDSGIGSDEGPSSRTMTSSVSPPHLKGRNMLKSLESLDEVESRKEDHPSSRCSSATHTAKNCSYPMSPPLTPPVTETKLTPHIFVDISSKCNTTPTRTSRSSYPPCRQVPVPKHHHLAPPKKLDYLPTPPPSGPTSPDEPSFSRSRKRRGNDGWLVADLDRMGKYKVRNDARLSDDREITQKKTDKSRSGDTTYSMSKDEHTWQASTLV